MNWTYHVLKISRQLQGGIYVLKWSIFSHSSILMTLTSWMGKRGDRIFSSLNFSFPSDVSWKLLAGLLFNLKRLLTSYLSWKIFQWVNTPMKHFKRQLLTFYQPRCRYQDDICYQYLRSFSSSSCQITYCRDLKTHATGLEVTYRGFLVHPLLVKGGAPKLPLPRWLCCYELKKS